MWYCLHRIHQDDENSNKTNKNTYILNLIYVFFYIHLISWIILFSSIYAYSLRDIEISEKFYKQSMSIYFLMTLFVNFSLLREQWVAQWFMHLMQCRKLFILHTFEGTGLLSTKRLDILSQN